MVASLWKVEDQATRAMMERFYQNLWGQQPQGPLAALRAAQLWMLREGANELWCRWRSRRLQGGPTACRLSTGRRSCSAAIGGRVSPYLGSSAQNQY